jgi:hypothetical protein
MRTRIPGWVIVLTILSAPFVFLVIASAIHRTPGSHTRSPVGQKAHEPVEPPDLVVPATDPLPFEIVEQKRVMKGASIYPLLPSQYVLFDVKAALVEESLGLSEAKVRATLQAVLSAVRDLALSRGEQLDGVSADLYQSRDHTVGDSPALGQAEWWPKGHTFSPANAANINSKATYVESINIFYLPKPAETVLQRLPKTQRRAIYAELIRGEDKAAKEAEAQYPTNLSHIPRSELRTYDFMEAAREHAKAYETLRVQYERQVKRSYGLTEQEFDLIKKEASIEQWPFPQEIEPEEEREPILKELEEQKRLRAAEKAKHQAEESKRQAEKPIGRALKPIGQALLPKREAEKRALTLLSCARNLEDVNRQGAASLYYQIIKDFPGTPQAKTASERVRALELKPY